MCLPCKEEEDSQMSTVTADLYGRVINRISQNGTPFAEIDLEAPQFYMDSVNVQREVMHWMIFEGLLNKAQTDRLKEYLLQFCYRADKLIAWARTPKTEMPTKIAGWTEALFKWAKEDQDFFTSLINEIGDWYKYVRNGKPRRNDVKTKKPHSL